MAQRDVAAFPFAYAAWTTYLLTTARTPLGLGLCIQADWVTFVLVLDILFVLYLKILFHKRFNCSEHSAPPVNGLCTTCHEMELIYHSYEINFIQIYVTLVICTLNKCLSCIPFGFFANNSSFNKIQFVLVVELNRYLMCKIRFLYFVNINSISLYFWCDGHWSPCHVAVAEGLTINISFYTSSLISIWGLMIAFSLNTPLIREFRRHHNTYNSTEDYLSQLADGQFRFYLLFWRPSMFKVTRLELRIQHSLCFVYIRWNVNTRRV